MIAKLKYAAAEVLKRNPRTWHWVWSALPHLGFLLPHDKSYYGFKHLVEAGGGLFLDIGANNGMTAAGFRRLNRTYRILCIEANKNHEPTLQRLKRRIPTLDYLIVGVGSKRGELRLYTPIYKGIPIHTHTSTSLSYLGTSLRRDFSGAVVDQIRYDEQIVKVIPIDDLDLQPSIVKIDVEGQDYEALLGMAQTIARCRPCVMVEFTPDRMGGFGEFFRERKYGLFVFDNEKDVFIPFDGVRESDIWERSGLQVNVFAIPEERAIPLLCLQG